MALYFVDFLFVTIKESTFHSCKCLFSPLLSWTQAFTKAMARFIFLLFISALASQQIEANPGDWRLGRIKLNYFYIFSQHQSGKQCNSPGNSSSSEPQTIRWRHSWLCSKGSQPFPIYNLCCFNKVSIGFSIQNHFFRNALPTDIQLWYWKTFKLYYNYQTVFIIPLFYLAGQMEWFHLRLILL